MVIRTARAALIAAALGLGAALVLASGGIAHGQTSCVYPFVDCDEGGTSTTTTSTTTASTTSTTAFSTTSTSTGGAVPGETTTTAPATTETSFRGGPGRGEPVPTGGLPVTGSDVATLLVMGLVAVVLGATLTRSDRRGRAQRDGHVAGAGRPSANP